MVKRRPAASARASRCPAALLALGFVASTIAAATGSPLAAQAFPPPDEDDRSTPDPVILEVTLEPDTVFVGQPVRLRANFLFSENVQRGLRRAPEYELPSPAGFWVQELGRGSPTVRLIDGVAYDERVFRRLYFPLRPGSHTIAPVRLYYETRGRRLGPVRRRTLASDSLRIVVRPVPSDGRPESFTGAVGRFDVRAELRPDSVPAGGAAVLTVEVEGRGDIRTLPAPRLPDASGTRIYPPTEESDASVVDGAVEGTKRFTWIVVSDASGDVEIGPVAYGYFDPERRAFAEARTERVALHVTDDGDAVDGGAAIRPLRPAPAPDRWGWLRTPVLPLLLAIPLLGLIGATASGWRLSTREDRPRRGGRGGPRWRRRWRRRRGFDALAARTERIVDHALLRDVDRAFRDGLALRLDDERMRTVPPDAVRSMLADAGAGRDLARVSAGLLSRLERARYSPDSPDPARARRWVVAARQALDELEDADVGSVSPATGDRIRRMLPFAIAGAAAAATVAAAVTASIALAGEDDAPGGASPGDVDTAYRQGVAAYATGRFADAADRFRAAVTARIDDPNAWYNLGNALLNADGRGPAIHAWLRTLRLDQRDADARHNLSTVGAPRTALDRVDRWLPLSTPERGFAAAALWLLGSSLLLAGVVRGRRRFRRLGLAAVVPALSLAALLAIDAARAPTFITIGDPVSLRAAPIHRAETLRELAPGTLVREDADRASDRDGWRAVTTREGVVGWVADADVGRL